MERELKVVLLPAMGRWPDRQSLETDLPAEREEWHALGKLDARITLARCRTEAELTQVTADADGVMVDGGSLKRAVIENMRRCRVIARYGVGVDSVDVQAATEQGIVVVNAPDFCVEEVANHAIMLLLASAKKLVLLHNSLVANRWDRALLSPMGSIYGQTLALIGFGKLARATARKAQAFRLRVIAYDPFADKTAAWEAGVQLYRSDLHQVLRQADYVSLHTPLTCETRHLMGEAEFRAMKRSAYLINTSRGAVVDEQALIKALQEGWIAGAGLDVFENEPPDPDNPLLKMPNVIATIHCASYSDAAFGELRLRIGEEVARVLNGHWPLCVVNPAVAPRAPLR